MVVYMEKQNRPIYSMAIVRQRTGLSDRQIRYYEKMELINPIRTKGNQRIFTEKEINKLHEIKKLLKEGLSITGVKEYFAKKIESPSNLNISPSEITKSLPRSAHGLTSLYPVSNRAELVKLIIDRRKDKTKRSERSE